MAIRIAMGHIDEYDQTVAGFARQLGLTSVQLHCPANLGTESGHWTAPDLIALRDRCERDGLALEGLENVPADQFADIPRGGPRRDEQIAHYVQTIRNMATAGIGLLGYHFMCTYVWRTSMGATGRGGARISSFHLDDLGKGNALDQYKLAPATGGPAVDADALWAHHQYFLDAILPVAEEVGVSLALHPDDPPIAAGLGSAARIFVSPAALARADAQSRNSAHWGLNLCLGTVSEMGGQAAVTETIERLGPARRIKYVHFRDVRGVSPSFDECFLGEGNLDVPAVIDHLHRVGFEGFLIDDHVPAVIGDLDTWADTSPAAYLSRGRAHAIGYLQGVLRACGADR
ncbi:MAG: mannonate dehydratase [Jatrophihabitans sp.]